MKVQADRKRKDCIFSPGDLVLLRLQPYRQQTVQRRISPKLAKRYFGPFKVLRRIGAVAYELELPPSSRIHPVIHVPQLRAYHGDNPEAHFSPIPQEMEPNITMEPSEEKDEERRTCQQVKKKIEEVMRETTHQTQPDTLTPNLTVNSPVSKMTSDLSQPLATLPPQDGLFPGLSSPSDDTAESSQLASGTYTSKPNGPLSDQPQSHHNSSGATPNSAHIPNLEVKVSSAPDSNVRRLIPKRNASKPRWTRDFILKQFGPIVLTVRARPNIVRGSLT
jgi:hypothetical protein